MNEENGKVAQGRTKGSGSAQYKVAAYRADHPEATVTEVARALGISRTTAYKWWDFDYTLLFEEEPENIDEIMKCIRDSIVTEDILTLLGDSIE